MIVTVGDPASAGAAMAVCDDLCAVGVEQLLIDAAGVSRAPGLPALGGGHPDLASCTHCAFCGTLLADGGCTRHPAGCPDVDWTGTVHALRIASWIRTHKHKLLSDRGWDAMTRVFAKETEVYGYVDPARVLSALGMGDGT